MTFSIVHLTIMCVLINLMFGWALSRKAYHKLYLFFIFPVSNYVAVFTLEEPIGLWKEQGNYIHIA